MDSATLRLLQQLTDKVTQLESKLATTKTEAKAAKTEAKSAKKEAEPKRRRERPAGRPTKRSRVQKEEEDEDSDEDQCQRVIPMANFLRGMKECDSSECELDEDHGVLRDNSKLRCFTVDGYIMTGKKQATVWDRQNNYWRNVKVL